MAKQPPKNASLVATLSRVAWRRGTIGGERAFLALPIALGVLRTAKKAMSKTEETVALEKLKPGETLTIVALQALTRKERKAARR